MQTRLASHLLLLAFPVAVLADPCSVELPTEAELHAAFLETWEMADEQQRAWLDAAQRAWLDYRDATCALIGERLTQEATQEAQAQCTSYMARERSAELRLIGQMSLVDKYERSYYSAER